MIKVNDDQTLIKWSKETKNLYMFQISMIVAFIDQYDRSKEMRKIYMQDFTNIIFR